jgi:hypothetical protein
MPISYPNSSNSSANPTINVTNSPPYFPATVDTVFPVAVTGTTQTKIGTFFNPDPDTYGVGPRSTYFISAVVLVTGSLAGTGTIEIGPGFMSASFPVNTIPELGLTEPMYNSKKFMDLMGGGYQIFNYKYVPSIGGYIPSLSVPIFASCSAPDVTCSIAAIYFSYSGSA